MGKKNIEHSTSNAEHRMVGESEHDTPYRLAMNRLRGTPDLPGKTAFAHRLRLDESVSIRS
jgi:hypothetical protein